jgi:peptidylprolyl isomerase/FKBP-type peptidyl-prolyl cis-trans isomerase SlpA
MKTAQKGDTVTVHYTGKLKDGSVFDSSEGRDPLEFKIGEGRIIPGFEEAVVGMEPEAKRTVEVPPEQGYGQHQDGMTKQFSKDQLPDDITPQVGQRLQLTSPEGQVMEVHISAMDDDTITIDANHPLAGKTLTFDIQLISIKDS